MSEKCIDACDELILWFGDGPYVERALELKMLYQPLTKQQEDKYRTFRQRHDGVVEVRPEDPLESGEIIPEPVQIKDVKMSAERFNTQNLQEELQRSMQEIMNATEKEAVNDTMDNIKKLVEDIPYLQIPSEKEEEPQEEEVYQHIETDEEIDGSLKTNFKELLGEDSDGQMSMMTNEKNMIEHQITGQMTIEEVLSEWEKMRKAAEAALEDARKIKPDCQLGDVITVEVKSEEFSRKAAKNAKNTIVQTIREQEKNALYNEYHSKEKELITGIVQRVADNGDLTIDLGRLQTVLKADDKFKDKKFVPGDRIKLYVVDVINREKGGPVVRVSRKSQELVKKLFEEEVTEIKDGVVEIMGIAREAGSRTKMAVRANVANVDPVGACVGINGARVKAIVNELGNEQIDIIEWDSNSAQLIVNALSPAKVVSAVADDEEKKAKIVVSEQQLSLAIGKQGQNVRLAAKLTGYGIDIKSEAEPEEHTEEENLEEEYVEPSELSLDEE